MFKIGDKVEICAVVGEYEVIALLGNQKEYAVLSNIETGVTYPIQVYVGALSLKKEKKQPSFSIKEGSIESAAQFIVANNNYQPYYNINECVERIKRCIARMIKRIKNGEEAYRCSTGGWTILIDKEDEDYYVVEVLVDTLVSQDREFVNVEEII